MYKQPMGSTNSCAHTHGTVLQYTSPADILKMPRPMVSTPVQTSLTKITPIRKPLSPPVIQEITTVAHTSVLTSEQTTSSSPVQASSPASTVSVSPPHHADQRPVASSPPIASTITVIPGLNPLLTLG